MGGTERILLGELLERWGRHPHGYHDALSKNGGDEGGGVCQGLCGAVTLGIAGMMGMEESALRKIGARLVAEWPLPVGGFGAEGRGGECLL